LASPSLSTFFLYRSRAPPHLPSFPTRRSSDLRAPAQERRHAVAPQWRDDERADLPVGDRLAALVVDHLEVVHIGESVQAMEQQRSEEHTSELQSRGHLVCRLLLEKKKTKDTKQ